MKTKYIFKDFSGFFSAGKLVAVTIAVLLGVQPNHASATPFDSNIVISGSAEFDSTGSPSAPTGNATQSGTLTRIMGGATTITTLSGDTVTGADPLSGLLTDLNDGFGIAFNASGSSNGATAEIDELFGDYLFTITNNSLIDTFIVNLKLAFDNRVDASGADAFAQSEISLDNVTSPAEIFFSDLSSDTLNGNEKYVFPSSTNVASGSGGALSDIGSLILSFTLAPGAVVNLGDGSFELNVDGGVFAPGSFSAAVSTLLTVDSVVKQQAPPPTVPEPETLLMLGLGLTLFRLTNRGRQGFSFR